MPTIIPSSAPAMMAFGPGSMTCKSSTVGSIAARPTRSAPPQHLEPGIYALVVEYYESGGGAVAQFSWQRPNFARQIIPAGPLQPPVRAKPINPQDGDVNVPQDVTLTWSVGEKAVTHEVYFGEDEAAVEAATPADAAIYKGSQALDENTLTPALSSGTRPTTGEWTKSIPPVRTARGRAPSGASRRPTSSWSTTSRATPMSHRIAFSRPGSMAGASRRTSSSPPAIRAMASGSTVGHDIWTAGTPYAAIMETSTVNPGGGGQSMPFDYNNIVQPYYSETDRTWASPQNWKVNGVNTLVLYFRGNPARFLETAPRSP